MIRTYEASVAAVVMLVAMAQFVMLSAGRLGEQWDSTQLDAEVKKALEAFQSIGAADAFKRYSKIRDPDLLKLPQSEGICYRLIVNGEPVDETALLAGSEVVAADARIYYSSRDAARLVPSLHLRLLRSDYVRLAGRTMDHDGVDELAEIVMALSWDLESRDILRERVRTLFENQNGDGGWGFVRGEMSNALCTSLAVRALAGWIRANGGNPLSNATVIGGINWLKDRVHADGGYGSKEWTESSVDMTAHVLLAFVEAGLDMVDPWVKGAHDYLLRLQRPDGGFPIGKKSGSQIIPTALATEALIAVGGSPSVVERGLRYLASQMVSDGNFTFVLEPAGHGTYDAKVSTGYIVDCEPRGYEFWGDSWDDSIIAIMDVSGTRDNLTVVLRIERGRLQDPPNKQKIAIAFSHDPWPDTGDWWILNSGNPHTAGQGRQIDDPNFQTRVVKAYTYVTITNLEVPDEYDFFSESEDWIHALVGDRSHPIQDNPGRGYLIGYWNRWMKKFYFNNVLAWRALGSPRINRVCLDLDQDAEFDDKRLAAGDAVTVDGRNWVVGVQSNGTAVNVSFTQAELNFTRYYSPMLYNLSSIPPSASGLYQFGVISVVNKPSFYKDYKVILRDSATKGVYDEAYIWNGTSWNFFPRGSIWMEGDNTWIIDIQEDFLILARANPTVLAGLSGRANFSVAVEGDFVQISVDRHGPSDVSVTPYYGSRALEMIVYGDRPYPPARTVFGTWATMRETSFVYHALALGEIWLSDPATVALIHDEADLCQQAIKFNKVYNSVIEDKLNLQAWYKATA